jgi:N-acetyltransferase
LKGGIGTKLEYHAPKERNVFSVLGKRKLAPVGGNVMPTSTKKQRRSDDGKTQMQLHLGQKIQKRCKECGMQYVSSSAEDRELHAKFHKQHTEGVDVGVHFAETAPAGTGIGRRVWDVVGEGKEGDKIVLVDCFDKKPRRRKGQEVLEIVQRDLGAVEIAEADIWETPKDDKAEPRFRSFLYVREGKCVGFLLVERITEAFEVLPPKIPLLDKAVAKHTPPSEEPSAKKKPSALAALQARKLAAEAERTQKQAALEVATKKPLVLSETKASAILGICRIWTLPSHRGQGVAISLLDTAVRWHNGRVKCMEQELVATKQKAEFETVDSKALAQKIAGLEEKMSGLKRIERKTQVAFSQPTAAGTKLARKWMERMSGWCVYVD